MSTRPMRPLRGPGPATILALALVAGGCGSVTPASPSPSVPAGAASRDPSASSTPLATIDLPGEIRTATIRDHLAALQAVADANGGIRFSGTTGYDASVAYTVGVLDGLGYAVETPSFTMPTFAELPGGRIEVDGGATFTAGDDFRAMIFSAGDDVRAEVATVGYPDSEGGTGRGGCAADDWDAFPAGAIALVPGGGCRRRDAVEHAQDAGAVALITAYEDWEPGGARRPTLIFPDGIEIPVIGAVAEVGEALREAAADRDEVRVAVETRIEPDTVENVIAETGTGDGPVVMIGAHLDSVLDGPGINDNGSGVAAVLEIARILAGEVDEGTVRFALWGGEEYGLYGSRDYVLGLEDAGGPAVVAYLNLDMLGSVNGAPLIINDSFSAPGSEAIADWLAAWLEAEGIGAEKADLGGGSDHFFFAEAGIPTGGIHSGASEDKSARQAEAFGGTANAPMDPCYHLACDTVDNVDTDAVAAYADATARVALLLLRGDLLPAG